MIINTNISITNNHNTCKDNNNIINNNINNNKKNNKYNNNYTGHIQQFSAFFISF